MMQTHPRSARRRDTAAHTSQVRLRPAEATLSKVVAAVSRLLADIQRSHDELILAVTRASDGRDHGARGRGAQQLPPDCMRQIREATNRIGAALSNTRTMADDLKRCLFHQESSQRVASQQQQQRRELARGLHDTLQQSLAGLVMHLHALEQQAPRFNDESKKMLQESCRLADRCCEELRLFVKSLRQPLADARQKGGDAARRAP